MLDTGGTRRYRIGTVVVPGSLRGPVPRVGPGRFWRPAEASFRPFRAVVRDDVWFYVVRSEGLT